MQSLAVDRERGGEGVEIEVGAVLVASSSARVCARDMRQTV